MNEVLKSIEERRTIRSFTDEPVEEDKIEKILEAGRWAPSGKNNQPWRFKVVRDEKEKNRLAECTHYSDTVRDAKVLILVYISGESTYDRTKDVQSIGACCQNMGLATYSLGLGMVWNGEVLNHKNCVDEAVNTEKDLELMALLCIGYPKENPTSSRIPLEDLLV